MPPADQAALVAPTPPRLGTATFGSEYAQFVTHSGGGVLFGENIRLSSLRYHLAQGNESRLTGLCLQWAESIQQVLRVPGGALAAALD